MDLNLYKEDSGQSLCVPWAWLSRGGRPAGPLPQRQQRPLCGSGEAGPGDAQAPPACDPEKSDRTLHIRRLKSKKG